MGKFVIRAVASGYKFDLVAANGQTIAASEVYETLAACRKGAQSVKTSAPKAKVEDLTAAGVAAANPKFELYRDKAGQFRFRLKARNGKVIAASEGYATKAVCEKGIESVRKNAMDAETVEA